MTGSQKYRITAGLLAVFPLIAGAVVYILTDHGTYLSAFMLRFFPQGSIPAVNAPGFIRDHFCDICWAVSLEACIFIICGAIKRGVFALIIPSAFSALIEYLQKPGIIIGTFDYCDIIAELSAIIITFILLRSVANEKTVENRGRCRRASPVLRDSDSKRKQQERGNRDKNTAKRGS